MQYLTRTHLRSTFTLSIVSLFFGYQLWYLFSHKHTVTVSTHIPLSWSTIDPKEIDAPDTIFITLRGPRHSLYKTVATCAAHIGDDIIKEGENHIPIKESLLLLPSDVILVSSVPAFLTFSYKKIKKSQ